MIHGAHGAPYRHGYPGHAAADAATELARKTQNPISDPISVPFENKANFNAGPGYNVQLTVQFMFPKGK